MNTQHVIVPDECRALLRMHRTHYKKGSEQASYSEELAATFDTFLPYLPPKCRSILDIGAGLAGIDVLLSRHYAHAPTIALADKDLIEAYKPQGGYHSSARSFAGYSSTQHAFSLLAANDVPLKNVAFYDVHQMSELPTYEFDVCISLLSWGFHYPISTYAPRAKLFVVDVRKGTDGQRQLEAIAGRRAQVVADSTKWERIVC